MSEADAEMSGDQPPLGGLPGSGTQASMTAGPSPSPAQVSRVTEQGMTAPSVSPTLFTMESSSTEGRPAKGTPMTTGEGNTPVTQAENEAEKFLDSMAAVLDPSKDEGLEKSPVRPQVRLPPVGGSTVGSSFVSSASSGSAFAGLRTHPASSRVLGLKASPARMSSAESSRIAATLPQSFKTQLVLHGKPSNSVSSHQGISLGVSVPTSASVTGFSFSGTTAPAPLREPFGPPKQGKGRGLLGNLSSVQHQGNHFIDGQMTLGSLALEALSPSDVLFYFGVFCITAHLSPQFVFKYGGMNGKHIGAQLIMYGHTVLVPATSDSVYMARVLACSRALTKLRKYHPDWQIPPLPLNESPQVQWNWAELLEAFCGEANWPAPMYNASVLGSQWHCEIVVGGVYFRTFKGFESVKLAQNSVAHHALHQLLVTDHMDAGEILPASSPLLILPKAKKPVAPPTEEAIRNRTRQLLNAVESLRPYPAESKNAASLETAVDALKGRLQKQETHLAGKVSGLSGGKIGKQPAKPAKAAKPAQPPAQKKPGKFPKKPKSLHARPPSPQPSQGRTSRGRESRASRRGSFRPLPPVKDERKGQNKENVQPQRSQTSQRPNANLEPLKNSRLAPIELKDVPIVDPLASLKAIQDGLAVLSPHASFLRVMKTICSVLTIAEPDIRHDQAPNDQSGQIRSLHAHFNDPNPFLTRASPVFLGNVRWINDEDALGLATKRVILFLLKMCKDEVEVDVLEAAWKKQLAWLDSLEREVEHHLSQAENLL